MNDRYKEYNKYFSLDNHTGTVITEEKFQALMADRKIFITNAWFNGDRAHQVIGGDRIGFPEAVNQYMGFIVAESEREARIVAERRGWGEEIDLALTGIIDFNAIASPSHFENVQFN